MQTITHSDQETKAIGKELTAKLKGGDIVCLYGELGAGKTTLVKGLAEGLGITEEITSPTFTLMNVYPIGLRTSDFGLQNKSIHDRSLKSEVRTLVHIDTYRLKNEQELLEIGVEDYLRQPHTLTVIEWPEKLTNLLKNKTVITVNLDHGITPSERTIIID